MHTSKIVVTSLLLMAPVAGAWAESSSLALAGEVLEPEITHCRTDTYSSGQLVIEAEVTAVGQFKGYPVALLMAKVAGAQPQPLDLYLTELSPELRATAPLTAKNRIVMEHSEMWKRRGAELAAEIAPEKLEQLSPAEMRAKMDEYATKNEALEAEMKALQAPRLRIFGQASVDGSTIEFYGSDVRVIEGEQHEAFADLGSEVRLTVRCGG